MSGYAHTGKASLPHRYRRCEGAIALISESFERVLNRPLVPKGDDTLEALWQAPEAIVAHGTQADPLFFFANAAALAAFDTDVDTFVGMPSRLSAEIPQRAERQALLDRVTRDGYIDDYAGVRVTVTGRRFRIAGAIVWNLIDEHGAVHGQAARFAR